MGKKILIFGLGSMGKRRLGILQTHYPEFEIVGVDKQKDRCREVEKAFKIDTQTDVDQAIERVQPFAVFVCTPPKFHPEIVIRALDNQAHSFSEINLSPRGYEDIMAAAARNRRVAFLSSTFLYREEIRWMIQRLEDMAQVSYRYHVGQYLPDWHPWEGYKDFFVGEKEGSACKELMAIEFPWICKAFGPVKDLKVIKGKMSGLDLDYDDTFHLIFTHERGHLGSISIDCVSQRGVRKLEIFSPGFYLEWEGTPDSLVIFSRQKKKMVEVPLYKTVETLSGYENFIIENPYIEEVKAFFDTTADPGVASQWYGYNRDRDILNLIQEVDSA